MLNQKFNNNFGQRFKEYRHGLGLREISLLILIVRAAVFHRQQWEPQALGQCVGAGGLT